jgi:hypothetical protein
MMYIYLKYYLRHLLLYGFMVLGFFLIIKFPGGYTVTLKQVIVGIFIAVTGALATGSLHILSVLSVPNANLDEALRVPQTRCIEVALESHEAFYESLDYLQTAQQCKINEADLANGKIEARAHWSWASYGEIVTLVFRHESPKLTSVEIRSGPLRGNLLAMDNGNNYKNVEEIAKHLSGVSYRGLSASGGRPDLAV